MKIVHVITRFILGGADENTLLTCNGLAEMGHEITLIYGKENHSNITCRLHKSVKQIEIKELVRDVDIKNDLLALFKLRKLLLAIDADILHTHESKAGVLARLALQHSKSNTKAIHGIHIVPFANVTGLKRRIYLSLEKMAAKNTTAFISVSEALSRMYVENNIGDASLHHFVPSGMDVKKYENAIKYSRQEIKDIIGLNIDDTTRIILMSGTLEPRKRVVDVVKALSRLKVNDYNLLLLVVGDGNDSTRIKNAINECGMNKKAIVLGYRDDLERLIASADICIHAAEHEGLPRVVLQYLMARKPVVAMNLPGLEKIIIDGVNGHIVEDDFELFAQQVANLLSHNQPPKADNDNMPNLEIWSHTNMVSQITSIYSEVTSHAS